MKRYIKYILLSLLTCFVAASCIEELDSPKPVVNSDLTTLVPRVKSFTNQYVTKATDPYTQKEKKIEKLTVLIFSGAADEQENHRLIYTQQTNGSSLTLNKSELNTIASTEELTSATVVMFANVSLADIMKKNSDGTYTAIGNNLTLEELNDCSIHMGDSPVVLSSELETFGGFPMKGVATASLTIGSTAPIVVNLQILYAKVNFEISVAAGTENQALTQPSFTLQNFFVHNVAKRTSVELADGDATASTDHVTTGKEGTGSNNTFTFYIPESRYNPKANENGKIDLDGIYPTGWTTSVAAEDVKGYTDAMAAQLNGVKYFYDDLVQQYKPKLAEGTAGTPSNTEEGLATYVIVKGTYVDYRNTTWDVNYKIYLGKDNAQNFHVDRNSEYTNILTIKGIRNNDTYTDAGSVWIDHRVNVELPEGSSSAADCVTITRETLIDAHIEVRPLRVKWEEGKYDGVRVYLPTDSNGNLISWIGIERFTGENNGDGSVYCYAAGKSTGKRKHFTTALISELQTKGGEFGVQTENNRNFIYLRNEECAWIYFDENTLPSDREADINLEFYTRSGAAHTEKYRIKQRGLSYVGGYAIESYEEYLHTYDAADKYNLSTSPIDYTQQGLAWGFQDTKVSKSTIVNATDVPTSTLKDAIIETYCYDFFHESDGSSFSLFSNETGSWENADFGTGLIFTNRASANMGITIKDMGTMPGNAYQYCLSKNKFKEAADGKHTLDIHWYLPDAYELQSIINAANNGDALADLNTDSYYWSSQPSIDSKINIEILGTKLSLKDEIKENARAVSANGISDVLRTKQNRIRCVYSADAIQADMSDRIPDGIGGNFTFWMKAWNGSSEGYFNYMLPETVPADTTITMTISNESLYDSTTGIYPYPTKSNPGEFKYITTKDKLGNPIEGFEIKPDSTANWKEYSLRDGYYYTLATFPGLVSNTLTKASAANAYKEDSNSPKTKTISKAITTTISLDNKLSSYQELEPLDYTTSQRLNINFTSNGSSEPQFIYKDEQQNTTDTTWQWQRAQYAGTKHELKPQSATPSSLGTGSETGVSTGTSEAQQASEEDAKKVAFDGTRTTSTINHRVDGAYPKAKNDAQSKLDELLKNYPTTDGWVPGTYEYTQLSWNQDVDNIIWSDPIIETDSYWVPFLGTRYYTKKVTITCTVTVTASVTVTKPGSKTLYLQTTGTGCWGNETPNDPQKTGAGRTADELRMYCGNSFTITCTDPNYEVSKVKVYFSGSNEISGGEFLGTGRYLYARFVEDRIDLPQEQTITGFGSNETLQLDGMDYDDTYKWQQWSGTPNEDGSVTLVLADYLVSTLASYSHTYKYDANPDEPSKYIIIDRIEVKCTKKTSK